MEQTQLAAQLYTVRDFTQTRADLAESLRKIRAIGYRAVQVSALGAITDADVKRLAADNDLRICASHVSWAQLQADLDAVIAQHGLWDCQHIALSSMPPAYRSSAADYQRFAAEASAIGETLAAAGFTFSYHNHSFEFMQFDGRTGLEILYAESDPRYFRAEIDTYWVQHGGGSPSAWIARVAGRMPVVHLKDMRIVPSADEWKPQQVFAAVGAGNLDWPAILAACAAAGVEWYTVEQDICPGDPFESLALSYRNLRGMGLA